MRRHTYDDEDTRRFKSSNGFIRAQRSQYGPANSFRVLLCYTILEQP